MRVERTNTGLIIHGATDDIKLACLKHFSLKDPIREYFIYSGNPSLKKPLIGKEKDVIYITSGFSKINEPELSKLKHAHEIKPATPLPIKLEMTREPRSDLQRDCVSMLTTSKAKKITVELKPGVGKCEPISRKIPTPTKQGFTLMGDLKVGDYVFGRDGNPTQILDIFEQGVKDVYKITFQDGRIALCGLEHLWTVRTCKEMEDITVTTNELMNLDYKKYFIPLCQPVNYNFNFDQNQLLQQLYSYGYAVPVYDESVSVLSAFKSDVGLRITDISYSHKEECRCIMVDNPEHLYLTEDFIVTHNTFISMYSASKLGLKPLIVTPSTLLKNQWIENIEDCGIKSEDIATNIHDGVNKKCCVVTITSLENELRDDWSKLLESVNNGQYGIKIIDEAHLHLKGMLKFDALCNIQHNWYLSATLGRSSTEEDVILNKALLDAERFVGNKKYVEYQKEYIRIYLQDIFYNAPAKLCEDTFKYGKKGLIRSTYYNMLMEYKAGVPFINNMITMVKKVKALTKSDKKILLLIPMIEIINRTMAVMKNDPYFKNMNVVMVDGSMPLSRKRENLENGDLILATVQSMGVGVDVSDLISVINFDQYASPIITEQIVGRLRDRGYETVYVDICDRVKYAKTISNWGRKRREMFPYFPGVFREQYRWPNIYC